MTDRYPRLTPMRAFTLLNEINDLSWQNDVAKLNRVREALSNHVKAALATGKKRRSKAKVVKLRSVG